MTKAFEAGEVFGGKSVVITGGLGFIGSNLALKLLDVGAKVTVIDSFLPEHGANWRNIAGAETRMRINLSDVRDRDSLRQLLRGAEYVFHLAGQVSHVLSLKNPFPDIDHNITATAVILETIRELRIDPVVVYTGTRGQYGAATRLPVNEDQPSMPRGIYELTNLTAEKMMQIYHWNHKIRTVPLRLTNTYGPRAQMRHPHFGVVNWFVRQALRGENISIFGTGKILRDFLYVDDCVDALLRAASMTAGFGEIINIGSDRPRCFLDVANILRSELPATRIAFTEFSPERAAQEPGDFYSDISKARSLLSWEPRIELETGLLATLEYYKSRLPDYL